MLRIIFFFLSIFCFSACMTTSRMMKKGDIVQANLEEVIPFKYYKKHIYVDVKVNGRPLTFLLDTGAPNVIDMAVAAELGLSLLNTNYVTDSQNQRQALDYMKGTIQIGGIEIKNTTIIAADFSFKGCLEFDGLLGSNFMRFFNWEIDYEQEQIKVYKHQTKPPRYSTKIPFYQSGQFTPYIKQIRFDTIQLNKLTMDTGSGGTISIAKEQLDYVKDHHRTYRYGETNRGLYGFKIDTTYYAKIESMYFDSILIDSIVVYSNNYTKTLVGNDFWDDFGKIFIDWKNKQLHLPNYPKRKALDFTDKQLQLRYESDKQRLVVASLYEQSSPAIQQLDLNDQVIEINKQNTTTLRDYCSFRKKQLSAKMIHLKIKKQSDNSVVEISLPKDQLSWY